MNEDPLQRHLENVEELQAQLEDHDRLILVDDDDNTKKYVITDVRYDGDNIVAALAPIKFGG